MRRIALALLAASLAAACSGGSDEEGKRRVFSHDARAPVAEAPAPRFDPARPLDALLLSAGEVARRMGSFEWTGAADWTIAKDGDDAGRVHIAEHHSLRQAATGEFQLDAEVDPGQGPGSIAGKHVIYTGGVTFAHAEHAPFRARPTDHGRDARRFRDESFQLARSLAELYGPALELMPEGETTVLGRAARRYRVALAKAPAPSPPAARTAAPDPDSARHFAFLDGKLPSSVDGELDVDAQTGVPLRVRLAGAFTVKDVPGVRATVELVAQVKAVGAQVAAVTPPAGALPDVRKPPGVAGALEAAGLKKKAEGEGEREEDQDSE
jgi:hypothetical protein